ncbi:MAG: Stk1 family PASTA domain-containing Ser/Thr kinase, partial [Lachnospiraceae bacterium]|nr:Stk1 family PASTA domain-containing Ser/Thr kinase [Lachnospiraceae bacterium]
MLNSGTRLGNRYEIIEKIGTGGMSNVYRAKDHSLNREVAIKVLKEEYANDTAFVTKFRAEAQAAAGLEHPNIVNVYDVGKEDESYYIVMEHIEGITLKTYIAKKGQLSYNEVISIAIQVGRGIEAAHKKGIIHRDIKPQNIMISKEGKVKVTDFGIAHAVSSNTVSADLMGSVHYSSPEQARNGYVTYSSDIYSLGIVMYEMCTGRVPFDGETTVAIAIQHLQSEMQPPSVYAPNLHISLEKIIKKCTMKSPDRRYASIDELLVDLKKALINPDEDFVSITDTSESGKTRVITEEEVDEIRVVPGTKVTPPPKKREKPKPREEEFFEDEDEDDSPINTAIDRAISIMGVVAAIVILGIFVFMAGTFLDLFHFNLGSFGGSGGSSTTPKNEEQQAPEAQETEEDVEEIEVPSLLGLTEAEAKEALSDLGLVYADGGEVSNEEYEEGKICAQSEDAGTYVAADTVITVKISSGKGELTVPDVVGQTESVAEQMIRDVGFKSPVKEYEYSDSVEQGTVISQSPKADEKGKESDTITIVVSQGVENTKVPSVSGMTQADAMAALEAEGFSVSVEQSYSDSIDEGFIISQTPNAGEYADKGANVTIVVSQGTETVFYSFSMTVEPRDGEETDYTLEDANGDFVEMWTINSTKTLSKNNITTPTGTL